MTCMSDTIQPSQDEAVRNSAIAWYVRLKDPIATEADRQAFAQWLKASDEHLPAYQQIQNLWDQLSVPAEQLGKGQWYRQQRATQPFFRRFAVLGSLASCVILMAMGLLWWQDPGITQRWQADYATVPGQQAEFMLSDGSKIFLGDDTALKIDLSQPDARKVTLLRGRAWFDVTPDPARRFSVQHNDFSVEVLGTAFTVSAYGYSRTVAVEKGRVKSQWQDDSLPAYVLTAGNYLRYVADSEPQLLHSEIDLMQAWRNGLYVFDRVPLIDVVYTLESAIPGRLLLSKSLHNIPVTGIFQRGEPDTILNGLTRSLNLKTQYIPGIGTRIYRD